MFIMLQALALLHSAANRFDLEGSRAFPGVNNYPGVEVASTLLVAHLRRSAGMLLGSDLSIEGRVDKLIQQEFPDLYQLISQPIAPFYTGRWYCLDNFSAFGVMFRGRLVPTVEHAYQASKFMNERIANIVANAPSAHEAKKKGNDPTFQMNLRPDWNEVKAYDVMKPLLRDKLLRHEYVRRKLIESKGLLLVEDSPTDSFWGRGPDFKGLNMLGKLWMELRNELE